MTLGTALRYATFIYLLMIQIFSSNKNIRVLEDNVNSALTEVNEWLNTNKLSLNVEKSNHVIFHPPQQKVPSINLIVNQRKLEHKEYIKYLGVLIDSKLSWKSHIREISKKISVAWEF